MPFYLYDSISNGNANANCNKIDKKLEKSLELFKSKLPPKPYYTNDYHFGKRIAGVEIACKATHLQPNSDTHKYFLVFDVDRATAAVDWSDRGLPAPHLITRNPVNGHCHIIYILETSVKMDFNGKRAPIKFLADVEEGLAIRLGADLAYNGLLTQNPFHKDWITTSYESSAYELNYLSEFVNKGLVKEHKTRMENLKKSGAYATGRNCELFDALRFWAYDNFAHYTSTGLFDALLEKAESFNTFALPLGTNEVRGIVKSIHSFVTDNFSAERLNEMKSERARKSGLKGGGRPKIHTDEQMPWEKEGKSKSWYYKTKDVVKAEPVDAEPWLALDMSRRTYFRKKKAGFIFGTK
jgi:hypothetical protein